jgi:hypothetical protein
MKIDINKEYKIVLVKLHEFSKDEPWNKCNSNLFCNMLRRSAETCGVEYDDYYQMFSKHDVLTGLVFYAFEFFVSDYKNENGLSLIDAFLLKHKSEISEVQLSLLSSLKESEVCCWKVVGVLQGKWVDVVQLRPISHDSPVIRVEDDGAGAFVEEGDCIFGRVLNKDARRLFGEGTLLYNKVNVSSAIEAIDMRIKSKNESDDKEGYEGDERAESLFFMDSLFSIWAISAFNAYYQNESVPHGAAIEIIT